MLFIPSCKSVFLWDYFLSAVRISFYSFRVCLLVVNCFCWSTEKSVANFIIIPLKLISFSLFYGFSHWLWLLAVLLWHSYPSLSSKGSNYTCVKPCYVAYVYYTLMYFTSYLFSMQCIVDIFNWSILQFTNIVLEREKHSFAVLLIYAFISCFCMCPVWGSNMQPWPIRTTL